ncbi:MAG: di-trans,poly-cis-decaprenylcistransferase [Deltaproteobacteria bacterium]|nr:di-trans,poly-cis-decaprenylcistransferase [Deltaproteobacteria bacterium]|tara:strand:- start:23030 stop:23839 length:810 start_codon:yes stop_codon:yes gene_type:complete
MWDFAKARVKNYVKQPFYSLYERRLEEKVMSLERPKHVGVILDGNRRYARVNKFSKLIDGHKKGADKLEEFMEWCFELDIPIITIWAFSIDNFHRSEEEVEGLFKLIKRHTELLINDQKIYDRKVKLRYIGRIELLPQDLQDTIREAEEKTKHHDRFVLNIALAYGGREEITDAFQRYMDDCADKGQDLQTCRDKLDPDELSKYLYTSGLPEPDLIIRTSGEIRLSGFLLWQSAHSEFYFCDLLWPEFRRMDFLRALRVYAARQRRYGR